MSEREGNDPTGSILGDGLRARRLGALGGVVLVNVASGSILSIELRQEGRGWVLGPVEVYDLCVVLDSIRGVPPHTPHRAAE